MANPAFGAILSSSFAQGLGSTVSGIPSSLLGGLFNIGAQRRAYKYNQKLMAQQNQYEQAAADQAYRRQLEFYERQLNDDRTYNDPSAVKQRYLDAGLNPYSAFGVAGSYRPLQAPSLSGVQPADVASAPYMDPGQTIFGDPLEAAYKLAMIRNIDANTNKTKNETPTSDQFKRYYDSGIRLRDIEFDIKSIKKDQESLDYQLNLVTFDSRSKLYEAEGKRLIADGLYLNEKYQNEIKRGRILDEEKDRVASQADLNVANTLLAFVTAAYRQSGIDLNAAQIDKLRAETATIDGVREHLIKTNEYLRDQAKSDAARKHFEATLAELAEEWVGDKNDPAWRIGKDYALFRAMGRTYTSKYGIWTDSFDSFSGFIDAIVPF